MTKNRELFDLKYTDEEGEINKITKTITEASQESKMGQMKYFVVYTTILVSLIIVLYLWETNTKQWRELRSQEIRDLQSQIESYKCKERPCQYKVMKVKIRQDSKEREYRMRIYIPQQSNLQMRGIIFFIFGLCGNPTNWEYILSSLANAGFIVVSQDFSHTYDLRRDVLTLQAIWNKVFDRLVQKRNELSNQQKIIIGHSYGGLVAQVIGQYGEQFSKIILYSPLFGLDVKMSILPIEILQTMKRNRKLDINTANISIGNIWEAMTCTKQLCTDQTQYDFDIHLIVSTHENLISNKKVLEFYENINTTRKELIVSKHITHYSQTDKILDILLKIVK